MSGTLVNHPIVLRRLTVGHIEDLGPRMRRITLVGDELGAFERDGFSLGPFVSDGPDDHVKVFLAGPGRSEPVLPQQGDGKLVWPGDGSVVHRDYTVRRFDAGRGELDLDFVIHADGVATSWVRTVQVGDPLAVAGPRSSHRRPDARHCVLVGDETALPAIGRWIEEAPAGTRVDALIEVEDADDNQSFQTSADVTVTYVHRNDGSDLVERVQALGPVGGDAIGFVAGEHDLVQRVRRVFGDDLAIRPENLDAVGYWRRGINEVEEHELGHQLHHRADLLTPNAIRVAATLRLSDHVRGGADNVPVLAEATGTDPTALGALMAHLANEGFYTVADDGTIGLAALGRALLDDHSAGERRRLDLNGAQADMDLAWSGLLHTVTSGRPGFEEVFGGSFWDHIHADPFRAASFDGYMAEWAYQWVPGVRDAYDWKRHHRIVDVGGGMGLLLTEILSVAPEATGVVLELPTTAATARWWFEERGVGDRAEAVDGNFFDELPVGDAVLLAQVLHDWPDADAAKILERARAAVSPGGRVLLVERLLDGAGELPGAHAPIVLLMRNLFGATERTEDHFKEMAAAAGLVHRATHPAETGLHILELEPA